MSAGLLGAQVILAVGPPASCPIQGGVRGALILATGGPRAEICQAQIHDDRHAIVYASGIPAVFMLCALVAMWVARFAILAATGRHEGVLEALAPEVSFEDWLRVDAGEALAAFQLRSLKRSVGAGGARTRRRL